MERLTAWDNGNAYYPKCFEKPCDGMGCNNERCEFRYEKCKRLAEYEDTGLSPEEIKRINSFDGSQSMKYLKLYQEEQRKHSWIPVSERLPEEQKFYLVTIAKNTGGHDIEYCFYECGKWLMIADGNSEENTCWEEEVKKVVAWMPLPEPYKPE